MYTQVVISFEKPHRILNCGQGVEDLLDISADMTVGRTMKMLYGPKTNAVTIDSAIKNAMLMKTSCLESVLYSQHGKPKYTSIKVAPSLSSQSGDLVGIELILRIATPLNDKKDTSTLFPGDKTDICNLGQDDTGILNTTQIILEESTRKEVLNQESAHTFAHEVMDRVCIAQNIKPFKSTNKFRCFRLASACTYHAFCDDFGPMSISSITAFIKKLDYELSSSPSCKIIFCADQGRRALTNAVFLLGAYMILKMELGADEVARRFEWLGASSLEAFRDASFSTPDFGLTLHDCWRGLERGRAIGWVRAPTEGEQWGMIDVEQHAHYGDALNGDAHVVVPGKLVAFRGPQDLACGDFSDAGGRREFSAGYYAGVLAELGVTDVVRLGGAEYERGGFVSRGIAHHDLAFDDCSAPPDAVIAAFFAVADAADGAVAVHCKGGLGRTGTLVALYLMRSHGFGAREAMGWLRIMRPGSVIGEQQHYLCEVERRAARTRAVMAAVRAAQGGAVPRGLHSAFVPAAGRRGNKVI